MLVKPLKAKALRFDADGLQILDQRHLPKQVIWRPITSPDELILSIQTLQVRGAPLIGVAAALSLAEFACRGASQNAFRDAALRLRQARPTAVNLMWAIDHVLACSEQNYSPELIMTHALQWFHDDVRLCKQIGEHGSALINPHSSILTHCNTGALATAGIGTAMGILHTAHGQNKAIHVFVDETRPLLQGGRLTTWELAEYAIPFTLICDSMAGQLMAQGKIDAVLVGADRIARNGDVANKIGTYTLAVLAHHHDIPFYVAAPSSTLDASCPSGDAIPIELRASKEVRGFVSPFATSTWAPEQAPVHNPAFDVTPASLISAWVLEYGVYQSPSFIQEFTGHA